MRVHITGGAGSGKTTLAGRIAELLAVEAFDLDKVVYEGGNGDERPAEDRDADIERILGRSGWVAEGVYLGSWAERLFNEADVVVWLDPPWPVAIIRIVVRHIRRDLTGSNPHPGYLRLWRFLRFVFLYYTDRGEPTEDLSSIPTRRYEAAAAISRYRLKAYRCQSRRDIEALLAHLK